MHNFSSIMKIKTFWIGAALVTTCFIAMVFTGVISQPVFWATIPIWAWGMVTFYVVLFTLATGAAALIKNRKAWREMARKLRDGSDQDFTKLHDKRFKSYVEKVDAERRLGKAILWAFAIAAAGAIAYIVVQLTKEIL